MKQHLYGIEYGTFDPKVTNSNDAYFVENVIIYTCENFMEGLLKALDMMKNSEKGFYFNVGYIGEKNISKEELKYILDTGMYDWDIDFKEEMFNLWKNENGYIIPLTAKEYKTLDRFIFIPANNYYIEEGYYSLNELLDIMRANLDKGNTAIARFIADMLEE